MKFLILCALCALCPLRLLAQTAIGGLMPGSYRSAPSPPDYGPLRQRCRNPFRQALGRTWDLRPLFWNDAYGRRAISGFDQWQYYGAKVVHAGHQGILLATQENNWGTIFLRNYPDKDIPDGLRINFYAVRDGTHTYTDISGAERTVRAFDYGTLCDPPIVITSSATPLPPAATNQVATNIPRSKTNAPAQMRTIYN